MSHSPTSDQVHQVDPHYLEAWRQIDELLRAGRSFSGRERNCCFLNTHQGRFADISAVSGFNLDDDGRGLAVTDWDQDGDLDFWLTNRTGPRVRFLRNNLVSGHGYLQLQLQGNGTTSNRDAIGARVRVLLQDPEPNERQSTLMRTLRAGEGYLSQSSKWLHFGLGETAEVSQVMVDWPDGTRTSYGPLAANRRYRLVQGHDQAEPLATPRRKVTLASSTLPVTPTDWSAHNLLTQPVPLPPLRYQPFHGSAVDLLAQPQDTATLINLWATWCVPCLRELARWDEQHDQLRKAGITVLALSVDSLDQERTTDEQTVRQTLNEIAPHLAGGMASAQLVDTIQLVHDAIYDHNRPLPVPTSILVDRQGRLIALYKGTVPLERLTQDVQYQDVADDKRLAAALPAGGRWLGSLGSHRLPQIAQQLFERGHVGQAFAYAERIDRETSGTAQQVALALLAGTQARDAGTSQEALDYFQRAVKMDPRSALANLQLGSLWGQLNEPQKAIPYLQTAVQLDDQLAIAYLNLGTALRQAGQPSDAQQALQQALLLDPSLAQAHFNLGLLAGQQGRLQEAIEQFRHAVRLDPANLQAQINLAVAFKQTGQDPEALEQLQQLLQQDPDHLVALTYAGEILGDLGRFAEAETYLQRAVDQQPQAAPLRLRLARLYDRHGDLAAALREYRECERLARGNPQLLTRIAWILAAAPDAQLRDGRQAVAAAQRAVRETAGEDPRPLDALAAAWAETGEFSQAIETARRARSLAEQRNATALAAEITRRLQQYEAGQPWREPVAE